LASSSEWIEESLENGSALPRPVTMSPSAPIRAMVGPLPVEALAAL